MNVCPNCGAEVADRASFCQACGSTLLDSDTIRKCPFCSAPFVGDKAMSFRCKYCGGEFCSEHRLPESHLCRSSPVKRAVPTGYSISGSGGWSTSGRTSGYGRGSMFNISGQGRNLTILIFLGLAIGFVVSLFGPYSILYFIQYNALVYSGWWFSILTSMIVVAPNELGLLDAVFNAIAVLFLDRLLSSTYTSRQYYAIFVLTGVAGNLMSLLNGPNTASFGASGGIFGLIAGAVTADYARNKRVNASLVIWFVFVFVYSSFSGSVDIYAHLGGAVSGLVAGYLIGRPRARY